MSGLETAIRNALEKSDRANPEIRARIYQSARQALDSGLARQGVTDGQVIALQRQRLELKIREIEGEERGLTHVQPPAASPAAPVQVPSSETPRASARPQGSTPQDASMLGGATRDDVQGRSSSGFADDASSLNAFQADRIAPAGERVDAREPVAPPPKNQKRRRGKDAATLDVPPERAAKPRRRRSFLSVLMAWLVFFALIGAAVWWAYSSGLIQQSLQQAMDAGSRSTDNQSGGSRGLEPQAGFSDEWVEVFDGNAASVQAGASATVEEASIPSGGRAVRVTSAAATAAGDVAITVPADILQQLVGKSSTIALTVQSSTEEPVQFSVRCDFASLGSCARHRFTARQEQADVLLRVTFEASASADGPGRLLVNTALAGGNHSMLVHSVRVLPGQ